MLPASERLLIREEGKPIEIGPIDEAKRLRVGAIDPPKDEDTLAEMGRQQVPFFVKHGSGAEESERVEQQVYPLFQN